MKRWLCLATLLLAMGLLSSLPAQRTPVAITLPTDNDAIFHGGGAAFYQYIEREFQGEKTKPWEGGRYGFVRNPVPMSEGIVYSRFHEGIDIKPMRRDAHGDPLDDVRAIADGKVVYTNKVAGYSNYGRYIVVEHLWDNSPYYSLYGHLSDIAVAAGQKVHGGERIARMGYTGEGLNQARAHLHLELNLMLSKAFEGWYAHYVPREPNHHGIYNGINLTGIDIARFLLAQEKNPDLTLPRFLADEEVFYKVTLPDSADFYLRNAYPWLMAGGGAKAQSWVVSFARSGVPLRMEPNGEAITQPTLTYVKKSAVDCSYLTRGVVAGQGAQVHLTDSGKRLMELLSWPE
ncbi:MAG: M23 family metallopeptidase [Verrucomicrobiota bacterium]